MQEFALQRAPFYLQRHFLRQVTLRDRADDARHFSGRLHKVGDQTVHRLHAGGITALGDTSRTLRNLAFFADRVADARKFFGHLFVLPKNFVQRVVNFSADAGAVRWQAHGKVAALERNERVQQFGCVYGLGSCFSSHAIGSLRRNTVLNGGQTNPVGFLNLIYSYSYVQFPDGKTVRCRVVSGQPQSPYGISCREVDA